MKSTYLTIKELIGKKLRFDVLKLFALFEESLMTNAGFRKENIILH